MKKKVLMTLLVIILAFSFLFVGCASATYSWLYGVWKLAGWGVFLADGRDVQADAVAELSITGVLPTGNFSGSYSYGSEDSKVSFDIADANIVEGRTVQFNVNDGGTTRTFIGELVVGTTVIGTWN
jgi:hypothetical protein